MYKTILTSSFCFFVATASGSGLEDKMCVEKNIISTALSFSSITQLPI